MRTVALRGLVVGILGAASIAACSGPLDQAPKPVQAALDPFLKAGYTCAAPSSDNSAYGQWQCDRQSADGVHYFVVLDADDSRLKQVTATVDQSAAASTRREVALAFFADVARIDVGGSAETIKDWVTTHVSDGGQERIGPILVTLDNLRSVDHLVVFAVG
jgi:hypothetical protein